jgi:hypothetical protein
MDRRGYKGLQGKAIRKNILDLLADHLDLQQVEAAKLALLVANDNAFDAAVCVLAAADFLRGETYPPEDKATAMQEGWIWVKKTADH